LLTAGSQQNGSRRRYNREMEIPLTIMQAPADAPRGVGPYVVDFGDQTGVGLTAREVGELLESERNRHIRIYKIHQAYPDGRMELVGVSHARFGLEDCFIFYRSNAADSRADFEALGRAARQTPPPCRARVHLSELPGAATPHVVAILYPAEYADEMSAWLSGIGYDGGDLVDAGVSHAGGYLEAQPIVADRLQLWGTQDGTLAQHGAHQHTQAAAS